MKKNKYRIGLIVFLAALAWNCSSSATREVPNTKVNYKSAKFNETVNLSFEEAADKEIKEGNYFKSEEFLNYFKQELSNKGVLLAKAKETIEIKITEARIRSLGVAIWLGTFAGPDRIKGDVTVKNSKGEVIDTIKISVAYALGGFVGGQNKNRIGYLYSEFTKLLIEQFGLN
ncbi:hypothetical protein LEP1GSC050_0539 [Leptospira broomii serovar Hurstbridge str. 5399]|uniref:Lipoprotein n=1 Tax=Leptospira broomii serovar Hurstbridge str. 5399 TaxID=1049789 RepID=T0FI55_9LEPT|nr:hypothetical protein [Leptospira broomii]EQA47287.1 hypothetical protein LEP1GSC050_0539 [Leptospira broomii serovar Hurstbridge str. 5399]